MAQCRTVTALQKAHGKSGVHDKVTELVFFSRWLSLSPQNTAAAHGVLQNIPATEKEVVDLMTLSDPPEDINAPNTVMFALGSIHDQWPQLVARAVLRFPEGMKSYVAFLPLATIDIHSNFTGNAERVCRRSPKEFRAALDGLQGEDRQYVREKVFDAANCKAIFVSEAD
jgi:hypothetical protein